MAGDCQYCAALQVRYQRLAGAVELFAQEAGAEAELDASA